MLLAFNTECIPLPCGAVLMASSPAATWLLSMHVTINSRRFVSRNRNRGFPVRSETAIDGGLRYPSLRDPGGSVRVRHVDADTSRREVMELWVSCRLDTRCLCGGSTDLSRRRCCGRGCRASSWTRRYLLVRKSEVGGKRQWTLSNNLALNVILEFIQRFTQENIKSGHRCAWSFPHFTA